MLVSIAVLLCTVVFLVHRLLFKDGEVPPGPTLWQLWRKRSLFAKRPHLALKQLAEIHGPLYSFRIGRQLVVVASSPAMAEEILKTNSLSFSGRYIPSLFSNVPGTKNAAMNMARDCDASWKLLRSTVHNSIFSSKAMESAAALREAKAAEMVELLRRQRGKAVDIERSVSAVTGNITMNILSSRDLHEIGRMMEFLDEVIGTCSVPGLVDAFPILRYVDFWSRGKAMELYGRVKLIWGDIIKERKKKKYDDEKRDFLDVLNGCDYDDDQIAMILTELLIAGIDAPTITTVWLMAELIKNEQVFVKVRREIETQAVEGGVLKESLLPKCTYLQACIKETLRLHVASPFGLPRRANKRCKVGNYMIPNDTLVVVNFWAIHLDPNVWDDASSFEPRRFLDDSAGLDYKGSHFEFIPFSSGIRMCPGWNMAIHDVQLLVASLVYHFDWSLPNGENPSDLDMSDKFMTTLKMENPLCLIPKSREHLVHFE